METVQKIFDVLSLIWVHCFGLPALNKWLSVLPAVCDFGFLLGFHGVLCAAVVLAHKLEPQRTYDDSDLAEDDIIGAPLDAIKSNRKQVKTRARRYVTWVQRAMALPELLLYLAITQDAMQIHYDLFKRGKCSAQSASDETPGFLFDFCWDTKNRACQIIRLLSEMLLSPGHSNWYLLASLLGDQETWPDSFIMKCRQCLLMLMGGLWRRMVRRWKQWPWCLCHVVDTRRPMEHRLDWAHQLLDADLCCLDEFSRKLRARLFPDNASREARSRGVQKLFQLSVQRFIRQMLNQSVYTTSFLECIFGCFRQWVARSRKPMRSSLLSAKHVLHQLQERYRQAMGTPQHARGRPLWVAKAPRTNGRHVFIGKFTKTNAMQKKRTRYTLLSMEESNKGFNEASKAWKTASTKEKADCTKAARQKNKFAKLLLRTNLELYGSAGSDCGAWNLGDDIWPYSLHRLEADGYKTTKGFVKSKSSAWVQAGKRVMAKKAFDEGRQLRAPPCMRSWPFCRKSLDDKEAAATDDILQMLRSYAISKGAEQAMMGIVDGDSGARYFVQCISHNVTPFAGEYLFHELVSSDTDAAEECPYELTINNFELHNEKDIACWMVGTGADLKFLKLTCTRASTMANLLVTKQILLDPEQERQNAEEMKQSQDAVRRWKKIQLGLQAPLRKRRGAPAARRPTKRSRQASTPAEPPEAFADLS